MFDGKLGEVERAYMYLKEGDTYGELIVGDDVDIANSDYTTVVTSETIVTNPEDHTLYATWEKNN